MKPPYSEKFENIVSSELLTDAVAFVEQRKPDEAIWLSGFFAGWARGKLYKKSGSTVPGIHESTNVALTTESEPVKVLYGTETGNSLKLANELTEILIKNGITTESIDIANYKYKSLKKDTFLLFIISTHGDGDPPETTKTFFDYLFGPKSPVLDQTQYAVLGLGDSTYEYFCAAAQKLDERLLELRAKRITERVECDVDYEEDAERWIVTITDIIRNKIGSEIINNIHEDASRTEMEGPQTENIKFDKTKPYLAKVLDSFDITGLGSSKSIRHIELSLAPEDILYQPGDSLGILPVNHSETVNRLLSLLDFTGSEIIEDSSSGKSLGELLANDYEITALTPGFVKFWAKVSQADELRKMVLSQGRESLFNYMSKNQVLDLISRFPVKKIDPPDLLKALRKLQPRLYSISSSQDYVLDEVHITISKVQYVLNGITRYGVASSYLCDRVGSGMSVPVYIQENSNFRLPDDPQTPIIMIGAGTGIAPYRAFMQHREVQGIVNGKSWLFFGERNFWTDFLYQLEWQQWLRDKTLSRINVAFSRDQSDKKYVQHELLEQQREIFNWLQDGAVIYVCGDAKNMAKDVHTALLEIFQKQGKMDIESAEAFLTDMASTRRYMKDVY